MVKLKRGSSFARQRVATPSSNGLDAEQMQAFVERIEDLDNEAKKMHSDYMNDRRSLISDRRTIFGRAKDAGIPPEVLRVTLEQRTLDRRVQQLPARLSADDRYLYEDYMARLNAIIRGEDDPGPGVLVARPPRAPGAMVGRAEEIAETEAAETESA